MMEEIELSQRILVVAAHPDDEVLGCGGTMAKYAAAGRQVYCLFLGGGKASRFSSGNAKKLQEERAVIKKEARKAAEILGVTEVLFEDFPDQMYDAVPLAKMLLAITAAYKKFRPDIVFTHHPGDINKDHTVVHKAVMAACKTAYTFAIPASTEWAAAFSFKPNVFVDISATFPKKHGAMAAYQSELRDYPHPRSLRGLEIIARYWGLMVGKEFVEAFELMRGGDCFMPRA